MSDEDYRIGDRVILHGLKKAAHVNGRHGVVAGDTTESGRFLVDTDLWDPDSPFSLAVKPANLKREPLLPDTAETNRAGAVDGVLTEDFGLPLSFILEAVRFLSAQYLCGDQDVNDYHAIDRIRSQGPAGLVKLNKYMAHAWTHWLDPGSYHTPDQKGIYDLLKDWAKTQYEERDKAELAELSANEINALRFLTDSMENPAGVQGWGVRIHGDFWVVGMDDAGTYLVAAENAKRVYQVLGVRRAIYSMLIQNFPRPVLMTLTMIPFYGRLVYDGVVAPTVRAGTPFGIPPMASVAVAEQLHQAVEAAKEQGLVVSRLRQLEVPDGSKEGLPSQGTKKATKKNATEQGPPTAQEKKLVAAFQKLIAFPADAKEGYWVMRRAGYTEEENPNHMICLLTGDGMALTMFTVERLEPTPCEILEKAIEVSKNNKRPSVLCIDDEACYHRVKFLSKDVTGTSIEYYMPPTKEETDAAMMMGSSHPSM